MEGLNEPETRRHPGKLFARILVVVLIDAAALLLIEAVLPGFDMHGRFAALPTALGVGLVNALIWPVLSRFTLKLSVLTLGLWGLFLNAVLIGFALMAMPWVRIEGPFEAIVISFGMAILTSLFSSLFAIDEDSTWYYNVVRTQLRRRGQVIETDEPGIVFLEIDGLAHDILRRAMTNGNAPAMAAWVRDGSHKLEGWETDWSSQTGACQAGILHGNNHDMPAFRWWEKETGRALVTNHPKDAAEMEARQSDGNGLLADDGASRANILSGDAPHSMLTMSTVMKRRGKIGQDYAAYFARPYGVIKTFIHTIAEIVRERRDNRRQERTGIEPKIERSRVYAIMRAWATVIQLDLQISGVVGDILAGRPSIYTTFLAYDEVAHHSGIERPESLSTLAKVDREIDRIRRVVAEAPRPYHLVVLSDHGQSQGATFLQRYGVTLEEVVEKATGKEAIGSGEEGEQNPRAYITASAEEASHEDGAIGSAATALARRDPNRDDLGLEGGPDEVAGGEGKHEIPELSVMASGCLGLVTFPREPGRLTRERIDELYPGLLDTLVSHPGIGFVMVDSEHGGVALGAEGLNYFEINDVEGVDPLAAFGPNTAAHVLRTHRFSNCPDIMINSTWWEEMDEVAAFEELVGSHGGMGGTQSHPFVLHPVDLEWPEEPVIGAEAVHRILKSWLPAGTKTLRA
ncbi:MAG TPA: phage holin family protein [Solirubrobacterales bacterium]|nr:phage holin family protein [Solirubrobacterales bacterium]HMU27968.1 phage holin family protein [Solirubrobacterales bacterium]HMW44498.1 phage holin family protein [Solirubrobacterales bacterium]HMX70557.1 phage holin family protein [Solirubrobacterales bacterium]HMY26256.1 phage holin family protein [Solirubrobacterales bacterium]